MPTYAILCEQGTFRGSAGLDEVYELNGRLFGVVDEPNLWDLGRYYVYLWSGEPDELENQPAARAGRWQSSAA
jgi:hypothetical protein